MIEKLEAHYKHRNTFQSEKSCKDSEMGHFLFYKSISSKKQRGMKGESSCDLLGNGRKILRSCVTRVRYHKVTTLQYFRLELGNLPVCQRRPLLRSEPRRDRGICLEWEVLYLMGFVSTLHSR